ncbi:MAG: acyl-CoA synthetase, partial [Trueperella pyogenes]|nr:acyl-CoA synthetase [Trueperella pyogenes]
EAVSSQIGRPQAPRRVIFVSSIPQLSSGKVDRIAARQLAESLTGTESEWRR